MQKRTFYKGKTKRGNKSVRNRTQPMKTTTRRRRKNMVGGSGFSYSTPSVLHSITGQQNLSDILTGLLSNVKVHMGGDFNAYERV